MASAPTDDPKPNGRAPQARSRITNGKDLLPDIDQRSTWARRFRDLLEVHGEDLGGADRLSESQRQALRRIAALEIECEYIETAFALRTASDKQTDLYLRSTGLLKRLYELVGLERQARDTAPDLRDYLAAKRKAADG